jgi:hypothetical protein
VALRCSNTLWLGPDHLLWVLNNSYTEEYKRFYFRDIQALIVRETAGRWIQAMVMGLAFLPFAGLTLVGIHEREGWLIGIMGAIAGIIALLFVINLARGPTCAVYLQTAVQTERLYALNRLRTARRTIALIRQAVVAVQGELDPAVFEQTPADSPQIIAPPVAPRVAAPRVAAPVIQPFRKIRWHAAMAAGLLVLAFGTLAQLSFLVLRFIMLPVSLALVYVAIAACVGQRNTNAPPILKGLTWAALVFIIMDVFIGFIPNGLVIFGCALVAAALAVALGLSLNRVRRALAAGTVAGQAPAAAGSPGSPAAPPPPPPAPVMNSAPNNRPAGPPPLPGRGERHE